LGEAGGEADGVGQMGGPPSPLILSLSKEQERARPFRLRKGRVRGRPWKGFAGQSIPIRREIVLALDARC